MEACREEIIHWQNVHPSDLVCEF